MASNAAPLAFDVLIVGSGFGGSVTAARLAAAGHRVAILETGKRWAPKDHGRSNWDLQRYLWAPRLRCFGIQRISFLKGLMVLRGAGVGGGSLVYANTLLQPDDAIFRDGAWPAGVDWANVLRPFFAKARLMLGVTQNQFLGPADAALREVAERMGVAATFKPTDVAVFFGAPGQQVSDPYFGGKGPARSGCTLCGGCMIGCRVGAKNTLNTNYLYFAERDGAKVFPELSATRITPVTGGYRVETESSTSWRLRPGPSFSARRVVLAAGALGTLDLLLRNRDVFRTLPNVSGVLGDMVRTNGESLVGATSIRPRQGFSKGIAIGASIQADPLTKIEAVRYPSGSSFMRVLGAPLTPDGDAFGRPLKLLARFVLQLPVTIRELFVKDWADRSIILLVMQAVDRKIDLRLGRSLFTGFRRSLVMKRAGARVPTYMPAAQVAATTLGQVIDGVPQNSLPEVLLGMTSTAHILGGCKMGDGPEAGVVDHRHEVFGYPDLYVCDGSVIASNLGVNPSLTIAALAERFASLFPDPPP